MELFKPHSKKNAVKVIAFAINFEQELSFEQLLELINKLKINENLKNSFNEEQIQNEISMTINQEDIPSQETRTSGIIFNKINDNKILWSLIIDKNRVVITCRDYSRWDKISSEVLNYIDIVFSELKDDIKIKQLTLEYLDEFEILQKNSEWKRSLFKDNCEYITPNMYSLDDFWHISQGYFVKLDNIDDKILDTIDINYFADEIDSLIHKVNMRMQHNLYYTSSIVYNNDNIKNYFHTIHLHSKDIFFRIVNNEVTDRFSIGNI